MNKTAALSILIALFLSITKGSIGNNSQPEPLTNGQILILIDTQAGLPMADELLPAFMHDFNESGISLDNVFIDFLDLHRITYPQYKEAVISPVIANKKTCLSCTLYKIIPHP